MDLSSFICPECENTLCLMRNRGEQRERGHIKDMWCPFCKEERKFIELKACKPYTKRDGTIVYG